MNNDDYIPTHQIDFTNLSTFLIEFLAESPLDLMLLLERLKHPQPKQDDEQR